jgi:threonine dehydrogenase-like Zn-dependent dehydrogenase
LVLEERMDSRFFANPLAMESAIRLMERGVVDPEKVITHRFPLEAIGEAMEVMGSPRRNKVIINP